jgi:lipopolysaccharide transport system ATP-binding protein
MSLAIKVENLSKRYRLGVINRDMLYKDWQSRWAKWRGKPDPNAPVGVVHDSRIEHGDDFWALRNVNLEVNEGEVYGIIGKNGAGKSTLLKILSQITAPTEGRIKIRGRIASLLEVGTGFHPELTGRENVYLNGAILGMSRKEVETKFDEIVQFSEIEDFIDTPVKRYSSGMYVRLAFGVAAHLDPDILVVDEVLAVGDAAFQKKCITKMNSVASQGKTVIIVTHSMALARSLTKRSIWMDQGKVREIGLTSEVIEAYLATSDSSHISAVEGLGNNKLRRGPGHARIDALTFRGSEGGAKNRFRRGEKIFIDIGLKSFKRCDGLVLLVGLKLGAAGNMLMATVKEKVTENVISPDTEIRVTLELDSAQIPSADYDTYFWVGPANAVHNEYYDCVDSMLPPLTITEAQSDPEARTLIPAKLTSIAVNKDGLQTQ